MKTLGYTLMGFATGLQLKFSSKREIITFILLLISAFCFMGYDIVYRKIKG
jgi:hypothetical protein